ncbi:zinc ribbon domain-containing protein [Acetobacterium bakii]|nr:zinc ribbon domain-containing protein [Acetobacterium bakii]
MAKYCPKCYVGVSNDDEVCSNCGAVLEIKDHTDEIFVAGDFKEESNFVEIAKGIRDAEGPDDELSAKEMVADEIIGNGIVAADLSSSNEKPKTPPPVQSKAPVKVEGTDKVMTLGDWMITLLLLFIPIVNIVMLIIWSVDSSTNENKKHFAWAYLIYMAIGVVVSIIFSSILISVILAAMSSMNY